MNDTQKESMELIITAVNSIRNHLKRKEKVRYDYESDILDDLEVIETEAESWCKE